MRPAESRIGDWSVDGELGRGGMGVVLRAHDAQGRPVAIKVLMASASAAARRRLQTEVDALLRLSHPNLVRLLRAGEHRGMPYVVMELVEGESLARRLEREGPLEPRRAAAVALALCRALAHCHAHGVLHRDLKPANVLLDLRGEPRLVDFGLALDLDAARSRLTQEGNLLGTPGYWPPEQARGDLGAIDARSDVYALGATLYAMLTGEPPFTGENLAQLFDAAQNSAPAPPETLQPGIDPDLSAIVLACLEKAPAARPESAEALATLLQRWLAGERVPHAPRRRRRPLRLALLIALLGLAAGGWLLDRSRRAREARAASLVEQAVARSPTDARTLELLDAALALADAPELHYRRALTLWLLGRPDEARAAAERALAGDDGLAGALVLRARLRPEGERGAALADLERALRVAPGAVEAWELRAELREAAGDLPGAIADQTQAVRLVPAAGVVTLRRAFLREKQGDLPGARADYDLVLRAHPDDKNALSLRGEVRERLGDEAGALEDYLAAARLARPGDAGGGVTRLVALRQKRHEERELVGELSALLAREETAERYYLRAQALYRLADLRGARADVERSLELDPGDAYRWALLASIDHREGNHRAAEQHLTRAIELRPALIGLYMNRSGIRIELDDFRGAEDDLNRVLLAQPKQATAHLRLGVLRHRQERREEALPHYEQALALDPQLVQAYTDLANCLLELGRPAQALPVLERALAVMGRDHPDRRRVEEDMARVRDLLGR